MPRECELSCVGASRWVSNLLDPQRDHYIFTFLITTCWYLKHLTDQMRNKCESQPTHRTPQCEPMEYSFWLALWHWVCVWHDNFIMFCALFPRVEQPMKTRFLVKYRLKRRSLLREGAREGKKGHVYTVRASTWRASGRGFEPHMHFMKCIDLHVKIFLT